MEECKHDPAHEPTIPTEAEPIDRPEDRPPPLPHPPPPPPIPV